MTVQQLIDRLRQFKPDLEVKALWDTIPDWSVHRVEQLNDTVVIDVGDIDGDWHTIENDISAGRSDAVITLVPSLERPR